MPIRGDCRACLTLGLSKLTSLGSTTTCGSVRRLTEKASPFRSTCTLNNLLRAVRQPTDCAEEDEGVGIARKAAGFSVG